MIVYIFIISSYNDSPGVRLQHDMFGLERWTKSVNTASLLLARGADPNASVVPVPVLFFAVKNSDAETVRQLLLKGAKPDFISSKSVRTVYVYYLCFFLNCQRLINKSYLVLIDIVRF